MIHWCWALLATLALMLATNLSAFAGSESVSIGIVDTPRPQSKWGYAPGTRAIAPGTWVTWSNNGKDAHTVTAVDGSFDSGDLDPSEGFSLYFDQPGTFQYVCTLHPWMTGNIVVNVDQLTDVSDQPPLDEAPGDSNAQPGD
jgi:plastocyanin